MDVLTKKQSELLTAINNGTFSCDNLSKEEVSILWFLQKLKYVNNYATIGTYGIPSEIKRTEITEIGKQYLVNEKIFYQKEEDFQKQLESLDQMAKSAVEQARIAREEADSAKKSAKIAKRNALISSAVAIASLLLALAQFILPLLG